MYETPCPRTETRGLPCARTHTKDSAGGRLLLLRFLLTKHFCSLTEHCPIQVKTEKKREIAYLQSGRIRFLDRTHRLSSGHGPRPKLLKGWHNDIETKGSKIGESKMCDEWASRTSKVLDPSSVIVSGPLEKATKMRIRSNGINKANLKVGQDELKA